MEQTMEQTVEQNSLTIPVMDALGILEETVTGSRHVPLTSNVVVNEEIVLDLIDRVKMAVPDEIVEAHQMLGERERILDAAHDEAERLVEQAHRESEGILKETAAKVKALVAEHAIVEAARQNAEGVTREAENGAAGIRAEADDYARDVMKKLEEQLMRAVVTVRKGIETLPDGAKGRKK